MSVWRSYHLALQAAPLVSVRDKASWPKWIALEHSPSMTIDSRLRRSMIFNRAWQLWCIMQSYLIWSTDAIEFKAEVAETEASSTMSDQLA